MKFDKKSLLILLLMPLQFLLQKILLKFSFVDETSKIFITLAISIFIVSLCFIIRKDVYINEMNIFKRNKGKNIIIAIIGAIASFLILVGVNKILKNTTSTLSLLSVQEEYVPVNNWLMLISSFIPALAPFSEELVFRHELVFKHDLNKIGMLTLAVISSILFGLMHLGNYGGNIYRTIPLMFVAMLYCLLYKMTGTIWTSIIAHFIYNTSLSVLPAILILIIG